MEQQIELLNKYNDLSTRVTALETKEPILQQMLDRSIASSENLANTLKEVELAMVTLTSKIDTQSNALEEVRQNLDEVNKKTKEHFKTIDNKINVIEEKSKFDIAEYIKKNLPWIIIILGLGITYVGKYFSA